MKPQTGPPARAVQTSSTATIDAEFVKTVALEVGKVVAAGVVAKTAAGTGGNPSGGGTGAGVQDRDEGKHYTDIEIANLKGYSGVDSVLRLSKIWAEFQTTKNVESHRQMLRRYMQTWADKHSVRLDKRVYFSDKFLEALVKMKLNPGACVAVYESCDEGLSPLVCRPLSAAAIEVLRRNEEARRESANNRSYSESLKIGKKAPTTPPHDYDSLQNMCNTWTALIAALFTENSHMHDKLYDMIMVLESDPVALQSESFNDVLSAQVTWAMIEDIRNFLGKQLQPEDFKARGRPRYPKSALDAIANNIRFPQEFYRKSFPMEHWPIRRGNPSYPLNYRQVGGQVGGEFLLPPAPGVPKPGGPNPYDKKEDKNPADDKIRKYDNPSGRNKDMHPIIKAMMSPLIQKFGKVMLGKIMEAANVKHNELPVIQKHMETSGKNNLCYNWTLGCCNGKYCKGRKHLPAAEHPDEMARILVSKLKPGVEYVFANLEAHPSPFKKVKNE